MKKIYLAIFAILVASMPVCAQLTLTKAANEPVAGDVNVTKGYDSTTVVPKTKGAGLVWNFSSLSPQNFTETTTYTTAASVPSSSLFPSANLASNRGGNETEFMSTSGANFEWWGSAKTATPMEISTMTNSAIMMNWPMSIGSGTNDVFAGAMTIGTNVSVWNGVITGTICGSGTVILPGGTTFTNCLQVFRTVSVGITSGTNVSVYKESTYSYYAPGKKFPVVEYSYQATPNGTVTQNNFYCNIDLASVPTGIAKHELSAASLIMYPNPATEVVNVNSSFAITKIEILDINGRIVREAELTNSINLRGIAPSVYTIRIQTKDGIATKRLVIKEKE